MEDRPDAEKQAAVPRRRGRLILRTAPLKEARAKREKGEISAAQLKEVEDREIEKIIKKQEEVGLKSRPTANSAARGGISISTACSTASKSMSSITASSFRACRPSRGAPRIKGKLGFSNHPMLEHFKFLKAHTRVDAENVHPEPGHAAFPP